MSHILFTQNIEIGSDGKPFGPGWDDAKRFILSHPNQYLSLTLEKIRVPRTLPQNDYFHAICTYFGEEFGYTKDDIKKWMKEKIVPLGVIVRKNPFTGKTFEEIETEPTHLMTKERMSWFIDRVVQIMIENGYNPPSPKQVLAEWKAKGRPKGIPRK